MIYIIYYVTTYVLCNTVYAYMKSHLIITTLGNCNLYFTDKGQDF